MPVCSLQTPQGRSSALQRLRLATHACSAIRPRWGRAFLNVFSLWIPSGQQRKLVPHACLAHI